MMEIINEIVNNKREQNIKPAFASYVEIEKCAYLDGYTKETVRNELNQLYKDGKIKVHKGINHKLIEIC